MRTLKFLKTIPGFLLSVVLGMSLLTTAAVYAVDGTPPGLFELDGNTLDGSPAVGSPDDWGSLYLNNGSATNPNLITFTGVTNDPAPQTIFWKGGSKDINDVTAWWYRDGSVPDKDDIRNAYAAAYTMPQDTGPHEAGDLIVYFGLDRFANSGDAFAGFWFFQDAVALGPNSRFTGAHVGRRPNPDAGMPGEPDELPGDILVLVEYPQGSNAMPEIKVYEWDPLDMDNDNVANNLDLLIDVLDARCDTNGGKLACATTNTTDLPGEPLWTYTAKSGTPGTLPFESFFEGGVNVTRLLGTTPCFASFMAETRASRSETATLKDFVIDEFPVCGIDINKQCNASLNTAGDGVTVNFFGDVKNTGGSAFTAYIEDSPAGSSIDAVCIDDDGTAGCSVGDTAVPDLVINANSAHFTLIGGQVVRYEGSYSISGLPSEDPADTMKAEAYSDPGDIGLSEPLVSAEASTSCGYNVNPELTVLKDCVVTFLNGDSVEVTISGSVTNSGDVALSNLAVSDDKFGALDVGTTVLAKGQVANFSDTQTVSLADLAVMTFPPVNGVTDIKLSHSDEVTATADVLDDNGGVVASALPASDTADCDKTISNGIEIAKNCEAKLDYDDTSGRIVVRVDVFATVTNTGSENLANLSISDDPAVSFELQGGGAVPGSLAAGASIDVVGRYYPDTTDGGNVGDAGLASFSDEVTVTADGAFSGVDAMDSNEATCDLCP